MSGNNVVVAVRVRPINARELSRDAKAIVQVHGDQVIITAPFTSPRNGRRALESATKTFTYDHTYDSMYPDHSSHASQDKLYQDLGLGLLDKTFAGYNCCIFAYGQTGSGKSYAMMGTKEDKGIIPLICEELFRRISSTSGAEITFNVEVSYLEIYSEKVRDLLNPANKTNLRIREHPVTGPYVEDLSKLVTPNYCDIERLILEGNMRRTTGSTNMNEASSRSHAVFSILLTRREMIAGVDTEFISKMSLVDLAGSERVSSTGATGLRFREGAEINRSLSTLGRVISALAEQGTVRRPELASSMKVPYRDSVLTWLLKDSLGGNSLTTMIATISPADINYEETLSTLRYADSAKKIRTNAIVNEDQNTKMIRELKLELESLRARMTTSESVKTNDMLADQLISIVRPDGSTQEISKAEIAARVEQDTKLMQELNLTWEEKLATTRRVQEERDKALEDLGIHLDDVNLIGLTTPKRIPHLINLSEDPLLAELLIYTLKPGITTCGNLSSTAEIKLSAPSIREQHCSFHNIDGVVTIEPIIDATTMVNGQRIYKSQRLKSSHRIVLGDEALHVFRFNHPEELRAERTRSQSTTPTKPIRELSKPAASFHSSPRISTRSHSSIDAKFDRNTDLLALKECNLTRREAVKSMMGDRMTDDLDDEDIETLFEDLHRTSGSHNPKPNYTQMAQEFSDSDSNTSRTFRQKYSSISSVDGVETQLSNDTKIVSPGKSIVSKRNSDSERLVQAFNAARLQAEATGEIQTSSLLGRLNAARIEAEDRLNQDYSREDRSAEENMLVGIVIKQWRTHRSTKLARDLFENAAILAETQLIAKIAKLNLDFQFVILSATFPISPLEEDSIYDLYNFSTAYDNRPEVAIRIMDRTRDLIQFWPMTRLRDTILRLRSRTISAGQSTEIVRESDFLRRPFPRFTLFGQAVLALPMPARSIGTDFDLEVYSPYICVVIGLLSVRLELTTLDANQMVQIKLNIRSLCGVSEKEITELHIHTRFGKDVDKHLTTSVISGFGDNEVRLNGAYSCLLKVQDLPDILHFDVFGLAQSNLLLDKVESWDEMQEPDRRLCARPSDTCHPLVAEIRITELGVAGEYEPCDVFSQDEHDSGIFYLHQGLSRRIHVTLTNAISKSHTITQVSELSIHSPRTIDRKTSRETYDERSPPVILRLLSKGTRSDSSSTGRVHQLDAISGQWDSSMHTSELLDRIGTPGHSICVTLSMKVEDNNADNYTLDSNILLRIHGRDQRAGYIARLFSHRVSRSLIHIFPLVLGEKPDVAETQAQLQQTKFSGHDLLKSWKPRGISLVENFNSMKARQSRALALQQTQLLYTPSQLSARGSEPSQNYHLIRQVVDCWQQQIRPPNIARIQADSRSLAHDSVQSIRPLRLDNSTILEGHLEILSHNDSQIWIKQYFTIRSTHLFQYSSSNRKEIKSVLNLHGCRFESMKHIGDHNGTSKHIDCTFTLHFAEFQQEYRAATPGSREQWLNAIKSLQ